MRSKLSSHSSSSSSLSTPASKPAAKPAPPNTAPPIAAPPKAAPPKVRSGVDKSKFVPSRSGDSKSVDSSRFKPAVLMSSAPIRGVPSMSGLLRSPKAVSAATAPAAPTARDSSTTRSVEITVCARLETSRSLSGSVTGGGTVAVGAVCLIGSTALSLRLRPSSHKPNPPSSPNSGINSSHKGKAPSRSPAATAPPISPDGAVAVSPRGNPFSPHSPTRPLLPETKSASFS